MRQGGLSFYGSHKGEEGADADLMFQFCLPNSVFYLSIHSDRLFQKKVFQ